MQREVSDARNTATSATSSGRYALLLQLFSQYRLSLLYPVMSLAVTPGARALTQIPFVTHRRAIPCVRLTIAAFVSPYGNSSGNNPFSEAMNMIEALDFSI